MTNANEKKTVPTPRPNSEKSAEANRKNRRSNRGNGSIADWGSCNPELLLAVVSSITAKGFAVQFSCTRDGGSLSVRIVGDGEPFNEYIRPTEDLDEYLTGLRDDYR